MGVAVVGPLAFGIGVVDVEAESSTVACLGPLMHLKVTV